MNDIVKLAIVGSVVFNDAPFMDKLWVNTLIQDYINKLDPFVIISGGSPGIDEMAATIARRRRLTLIEFFPSNPRWAPDGYKYRNIKIAEACTHLLCIRHYLSKTYGSGWTADYAEKLGKVVERVTYNPMITGN